MATLSSSALVAPWPQSASQEFAFDHNLTYFPLSLDDVLPMAFDSAPPPPQFIEPQQLDKSQDPPSSQSSSRSRSHSHRRSRSPSSPTSSTSSLSSSSWPNQAPSQPSSFFLLPFPSIDEDTSFRASHSYHPRSSPTKARQTTNRVVPRSAKHARNLELNRKAATKCRTRQKVFVDNLQKRCKTEEEKMKAQSEEVRRLREEVLVLRGEVMSQSFRREAGWEAIPQRYDNGFEFPMINACDPC